MGEKKLSGDRMMKGIVAGVIIFLAAFPLFAGKFYVKMVSEALILALWGVSWNFMYGYTGMLSFGHATFYAIGAYTAALILNLNLGALSFISMPTALWGAAVISGVAALVIGYVCTRATEIYFSIMTLLFSMVLYSVLLQWRGLTGGDDGLMIAHQRFLFGMNLAQSTPHYYWVLVVVGASIAILWIFTQSHYGQVIRAIKENAERAEFLGVAVRTYRLTSFTIGGIFAGIAGALSATLIGLVNPGLAYWVMSAEPILTSLLGGLGYFAGPIIGATIYLFLIENVMARVDFWRLIVGGIFVAIVLFAKGGIIGFLQTLRKPKLEA